MVKFSLVIMIMLSLIILFSIEVKHNFPKLSTHVYTNNILIDNNTASVQKHTFGH